MDRTEYMHHVIEEYLSVTMTCVFALENYRQQTMIDANYKLREQLIACMDEYDRIYCGREKWTKSTEDLVDHKAILHFRELAMKAVESFIDEFRTLIPCSSAKCFDIDDRWSKLKEKEKINVAIISLVKEMRIWEEDNFEVCCI